MSNAFQNDPLQAAQSAFSPLPIMVQRFREMLGRPASAPPANLEEQAQGQQPRGPSGPPSRFANSFLPPGSPYPQPRGFQPFQPPIVPRPAHQWGQEEQFPNLPQSFEVPGLLQGVFKSLGQNGSATIARMAMAAGPHMAEFLAGVQQGQEDRTKLALEQLKLRSAQMADTLQEELFRYRDVLSTHRALNRTLDPAQMLKPVNGKDLMTDFSDTAAEIGDHALQNLIASGAKVEDVIQFLNDRDKQLTVLQKAKAAVADESADDARLGVTSAAAPAGQQPSAAASGVAKYLGEDAPAAAAPPQIGGPAPAAPDAPDASKGGAGGEATAKEPLVLVPDKDGNMVPANTPGTGADTGEGSPIDSLKHQIISGARMPPALWQKMDPKAMREAVDRSLEANATLDRIVRDTPLNATQAQRDKILPMVRAIDPALARDVELVNDYRDPASGGVSGTGGSPGTPSGQYSNRLRQIVTLINPNWNQGFYQDQHQFRHDRNVQLVLSRTKDLGPVALQLAGDLRAMERKLKAAGLDSRSVNLDVLGRYFGTDTEYTRFKSDFLAYNNAYNTIVTAGHNTITGVKMQEEGLQPWTPLASYRAIMQGHAVGVDGMIQAQRDRWESIGGRADNMPSGDNRPSREAFKIINAVSKWDYVSGAMPYDPENKDNDIVIRKGRQYYWTGAFPLNRDDPRNWKPVQ